MKHLAAYLLLLLGGTTEPSADDIKKVLGSVGISADEERLAQLLKELHGRDIEDLIAEGTSKLAVLPGNEAGGDNATGEVRADNAGNEEKETEKGRWDLSESDDDEVFYCFPPGAFLDYPGG